MAEPGVRNRVVGWGVAARRVGLATLACLGAGAAAADDAVQDLDPRQILSDALAGATLQRYERVALTTYREEEAEDGLSRALELYVSPSPEGSRIFGTVVGAGVRRGTSFLILPGAESEEGELTSNQYFAYLPETGRVRRLNGTKRGDAFFGSHLSLADFELHPAEHFETLGMRQDTLDSGSGSPEPVYRMEVEPRFEAGYDRAEFWIAVSDRALLRCAQYRSGREEPIRTIEVRRDWLDSFERGALPRKRVIRTAAPGRTELVVIERTTAIEIPDSTFTVSYMRRKGR